MNIRRFIEKVDKKKKEILKQSKLSNAELYIFMAGMNSAMEAIEECGGDCCGWMPVEEQLPEHDGLYLVCMDDEFIASVEYTTDKDGNQDWELWDESGEVAAWMPLPEPYKAEALREAGDKAGQDAAEQVLQSAT